MSNQQARREGQHSSPARAPSPPPAAAPWSRIDAASIWPTHRLRAFWLTQPWRPGTAA